MIKVWKTPDSEFDESDIFTDSRGLFDMLWEEWSDTKLYFVIKAQV